MVEMDALLQEKAEREKSLKAEEEEMGAFRRGLEAEVAKLEQELSQLKEGRGEIVSRLEPHVYNTYLMLLKNVTAWRSPGPRTKSASAAI